jgi:hypothetical protein
MNQHLNELYERGKQLFEESKYNPELLEAETYLKLLKKKEK